MKNENEALAEFFNRAIHKNMQKVDSSKFEQRAIVYRAALGSLEKVQSKNNTLSEAVKKQQVDIVSAVIQNTENQYLSDKPETIFEVEPALDPIVQKPEPKSSTDFPTISPDEAEIRSETPDALETQEQTNPKRFFQNKKLPIIGLACLLLVGLLSYLVFTTSPVEDDKLVLDLPMEILADEKLLKFAKARGASKVYPAKDGSGGLIFEIPADNQSDASEEEKPDLGRLDFIFGGALAKKLNQYQGEMLITFHLSKITEENLDIVLVYRAAGRPGVKNFEITDNKQNEYFILQEERQNAQVRPNAVFSIRVKSKPDKLSENPRLRLEKIVLSNI